MARPLTVVECDWQKLEKESLDPDVLNQAIASLKRDGCLVVRGAANPSHVAQLQEKMYADLELILNAEELPEQFVSQHIQHNPPPMPPFLFRDIMCNEAIIEICSYFLGPQMKNVFYSGNTNLPGSTDQPVHSDVHLLWQHLEHPYPASAFMINMPLNNCDAQSGSIELWPGSHLSIDERLPKEHTILIPDDLLAEMRNEYQPVQPEMQVGDFLIRDERLWHCGKANNGERARPMIAQIYASGFRQWDGLQLHQDARALLKHDRLRQHAGFFEGEFDYLFNNKSYVDDG